jgi:histidine triad (HIT) family protein
MAQNDKDCIFCKIANGEIPTEFLYQDKELVVFRDIHPVAPTHLLIVPRKHIPTLSTLPDDETPLIGRMALVANRLAREHGVAARGYRVVINSGKNAGQVVPHLHMHLLGGGTLQTFP